MPEGHTIASATSSTDMETEMEMEMETEIEMGSDGGNCVPVIDMAQGRDHIAEHLGAACKAWGCFQLINHGVAMKCVEDAREQSRLFFALPTAHKLQVKRMPGQFTGYGNGAVVNSEALNEEYYSEALTLGYRSSDAESIGGKLWPDGNPEFRKSVVEFSEAAHKLSLEVLGYMVDGLPVESRKHFKEYLVEQSGTLRVNNYPLCPQPALHTGLPPHIDACVVTVLHQSDNVAGLEVDKDGSWVGVQPRHDALVVMVGAIVQVLTNGVYKAVKHRALLNAERSRLSLAYSAYPPSNLAIVPASQFVSDDKPSPYRPFSWAEFLAAKQKYVTDPLLGLLAESS
ncbi:hypothetical protein M758_10G057500 [Ceratodon purpureus]|nr:hypothetical protein M758_10G057500 [Ceratodon purpureus]